MIPVWHKEIAKNKIRITLFKRFPFEILLLTKYVINKKIIDMPQYILNVNNSFPETFNLCPQNKL